MSGPARVLLIQMPFFVFETPSISLSNLRGALEKAGFECDIKYLNIEFGKRLGVGLYTWIATQSPSRMLFGDLVFAPLLHDRDIRPERIRKLSEPLLALPDGAAILETIVENYPQLVAAAEQFLADMLEQIDWPAYSLVGFNTMFQTAPALAMARLLKERIPRPPRIVLGGSNCEGVMGESISRQFPFVDYVCRGEGERLIVELTQHLSDGSVAVEDIHGLVWRDGGETICNGPATDMISDLDSLALPRYDDWLGEMKQNRLLEESVLSLPIETARGCWYGERQHCTFCGLNGQIMMFRRKTPERAYKEFIDVMRYGVKLIHAVDNILDFRYFNTLLPELAKLQHDFEIFYEIKSNVTLDHLRLLRSSGGRWLQPGIESLSTSVLKLMRKGVTGIQNIRLLKWAAQLGVSLAWNMLAGFPGENPADFEEMALFIPSLAHLQPPINECSLVRLDRYSPLFNNYREMGLTHVRPVDAYSEIYPYDSDTVFRMAYYFDFDYQSAADPKTYTAPVASAVRAWQKETGRAAFLCLNNDPGLRLVDTRAVAGASHVVLHGLEEAVFRHCLNGSRLDDLCGLLKRSEAELAPILKSFVDRRWAIFIDNQYLTLAVPMDEYAPRHLPLSIVERSVLDLYCERTAGFRYALSHNTLPKRVSLASNPRCESSAEQKIHQLG
jgi:ribosomal peptide maturation radical SAM protein 1